MSPREPAATDRPDDEPGKTEQTLDRAAEPRTASGAPIVADVEIFDEAPDPVERRGTEERLAPPDDGAVRIGLADATPRLPESRERLIRSFAVFALAFSVYWVTWRWTATLNWSAWWFSVPLVLAETYILLQSGLMVFTTWRLRHRDPVPAPTGLSVDVFITVYDEPMEVVRRTAIGARAIHYPHRTYLLDDGKRDDMRELARELGIGYVRRVGNEHAKAGNLNHALRKTAGDFVLQLDADHVPLPHILDRLLGFFEDERVAFVQSPQDFYNLDSFSYDVNEDARRVWEEQRLFFSLIQAGKDYWNAAFFCGSCGVIRRVALEEMGGFSTETITEDMETSMLLHARGWRSVYYGESLAYGLAPASAGAYAVQRLRWGQGAMQILRKFNPLRQRGLTWPQRLCYLNSVTSYLDGFAKLILYSAPVIFFITGVLPIRVEETEFLARFVPYLVIHFVMFHLLFRGTGFILLAERYNMAKFWIYTMAVSGYFAKGKLKFNVTPKGAGDVPFRTYAPQLVLLVVTIASVGWATAAYSAGWISYSAPGWSSLAFWLNAMWAAYNVYFAAYVVRLSLHYKQQRKVERFTDTFPFELRDEAGRDQWVAVAENLNASGMAFRTAAQLQDGARVVVTLPLITRRLDVAGEVRHRESDRSSSFVRHYGIEFDPLPVDVRDAIEIHCTHHAVPMQRLRYKETSQPFATAWRWFYDARGERRRGARLPVRVYGQSPGGGTEESPDTDFGFGLLDDLSATGARLLVDHPVPPRTRLRFKAPSSGMSGVGEVVYTRALHTPLGVRFAIGLRVQREPRRLPRPWRSALKPA